MKAARLPVPPWRPRSQQLAAGHRLPIFRQKRSTELLSGVPKVQLVRSVASTAQFSAGSIM
eukprot:12242099-Karenia_brevis.AAC.1